METELWIVQQVTGGVYDLRKDEWNGYYFSETTGVFDTEEKAVEACRDENYCIMPFILNAVMPHERVEAPEGARYPLRKEGE